VNIEEARQVLWLKSNPRPLGELLDEGYLTQDRLEWAAKWANNSKLKQAARILLDIMENQAINVKEKLQSTQSPPTDNVIPINIASDKSRSTAWSFPPYKGQAMGTLFDSRQLSLKDLGFAAENAWDK